MRNAPKPMKLFCTGSLYRYDEPQYGRFREFWQANYELIGSTEPEADMEIITLTNDLTRRLGFRRYWFKIGHMGILRGILNQEGVAEGQQNLIMQLLDKKRWDEALTLAKESNISQNGISVLKKTLETKGKDVSQVLKTAKRVVADYYDAVAAVENLRNILELTEKSNVKFETIVEAGFARGLEYYTGMIFELYVPELEIALGGGGRYDKLIELFGGEPTPAVGVAPGIDRLVLAMDKQKVSLKISEENKVMIIAVDEELRAKAVELSLTLRKAKIPVDVELMGRAVSKALSDANRRGATYAVIVGLKELKEGKVVLKDLKKREQRIVGIKTLSKEILKDKG
jgi:histidyl-tRNA synthetase